MQRAAQTENVSTFIQILARQIINEGVDKTEMSRQIPKSLAGSNDDQRSQFGELVAAEVKKAHGDTPEVTVEMKELNSTTINVVVTVV